MWLFCADGLVMLAISRVFPAWLHPCLGGRICYCKMDFETWRSSYKSSGLCSNTSHPEVKYEEFFLDFYARSGENMKHLWGQILTNFTVYLLLNFGLKDFRVQRTIPMISTPITSTCTSQYCLTFSKEPPKFRLKQPRVHFSTKAKTRKIQLYN